MFGIIKHIVLNYLFLVLILSLGSVLMCDEDPEIQVICSSYITNYLQYFKKIPQFAAIREIYLHYFKTLSPDCRQIAVISSQVLLLAIILVVFKEFVNYFVKLLYMLILLTFIGVVIAIILQNQKDDIYKIALQLYNQYNQ